MDLNGTHIRIPEENPLSFDFDWRCHVARCWFDNPDCLSQYSSIKKDVDVKAYHKMLLLQNKGVKLPKDLIPYQLAHTWNNGGDVDGSRYWIEPLLLTATPYDIIAADMAGPKEAYAAYSRLFFDVRDSKGKTSDHPYLRSQAALRFGETITGATPRDVVWKVVAFRLGYDGITFMWYWDDAHGRKKGGSDFHMQEIAFMSQVQMLENLVRGTVNSFDLLGVMTQHTQYERMRFETGKGGSEADESSKALLGILGKMAPRVIAGSKEHADEIAEQTEDIQRRLRAQRVVSGQSIDDFGQDIGVDALNEIIDENFANTK